MSFLRRILAVFIHSSSATKNSESKENTSMVVSTSKRQEESIATSSKSSSMGDADADNNLVQVQYLPEECIARIISFTSVLDAACSMSLVSKMFKSAADSDQVWERFLPYDIDETVSELFPPSLAFSSKKELFVRLCQDPVLIDDGKKILALEKLTCNKCYMIAPRELMISRGDNSQHWVWRSLPCSRFSEVAELLSVRWLDIRGRLETKLLSPKKTYAIYLVLKLNATRSWGFGGPVEVSLELQTGLFESRQIPWEPQERGDNNEWKEIKIGEFFNDQGEDGWVEMRLWEVHAFKLGLYVQGFELRPKETSSTPFA